MRTLNAIRSSLLLLALFFSLGLVAADKFFCPMRCEGKKIYEKAGTCPICGMYLVPEKAESDTEPALNSREYRIDWRHEGNTFYFAPKKTATNASVELDEYHGEPFQMVGVRDDGSGFTHRNGTLINGEYKIDIELPSGSYILFAEFVPKGTGRQIFPLAFKSSGKATSIDTPCKRKRPAWPKTAPLNKSITLSIPPSKLDERHLFTLSKDTLHYSHQIAFKKREIETKFFAQGPYWIWLEDREQGQNCYHRSLITVH